ncbi:hypothetical protein VZT92_023003 [Zoarces viviparus]|uniref:Homeobox domain-containing protein n=1 Tax=Zoarces viviparus TaxID=48416 RepID=A0AAW1E4X2_ZOAVI
MIRRWQVTMSAQSPPYQRARMRTIFTVSQIKQLESLFKVTEYPTTEACTELARSFGLSETPVRVWFQNCRAKRKRRRSGSKVKSSSPARNDYPCPALEQRITYSTRSSEPTDRPPADRGAAGRMLAVAL